MRLAVEPGDVTLVYLSLFTLFIKVLHITVETAFPKGLLVDGFCPVELLSIARYRCESTADLYTPMVKVFSW